MIQNRYNIYNFLKHNARTNRSTKKLFTSSSSEWCEWFILQKSDTGILKSNLSHCANIARKVTINKHKGNDKYGHAYYDKHIHSHLALLMKYESF